MIEEIRRLNKSNSTLKSCHHFTYDLVHRKGKKNILFLGINPGETHEDRNIPKPDGLPLEESRHRNFRDNANLQVKSSQNWFRIIDSLVQNKDFGIICSEFFFWSTNNFEELKKKFSENKKELDLLFEFCKNANQKIIEKNNVKMIIATGFSLENYCANLYHLKKKGKDVVDQKTDKEKVIRLISKYQYEGKTPWFFIRHPTGAFHNSTERKNIIKKHIVTELAKY